MSNQPWFFAPPELWGDDVIALPSEETHHATRVLRVDVPDVVTIFDGRGNVARCAVADVSGAELRAEILEMHSHQPMRPQIVVYQGAAKSGKLDDVVEKLAELGVAEMWAFESERSVVRWDAKKVDKLAERWSTIARSAAKQCRSPFLLQAGAGLSWTELLRRVAKEPAAVTLWEEASLPLRTVLSDGLDRVAIVIGSEGGFTKEEAEALADAGAPLASLGPRILRTENAAVVATAALLYHYGLLG